MDAGIVGGIAAAIITPWLLGKISAGGQSARERDGFRVAEYGAGYQGLMAVAASFFFGLMVLAYCSPGSTPPATLRWVLLVFAGFALFALAGMLLAVRATVLWNDQEISGADMWGRRTQNSWTSLSQVHWLPWATSLKLVFQGGQTIWLSPLMRGWSEFREVLRVQATLRGVTLPPLPENPWG
jgi:hypothetical protein